MPTLSVCPNCRTTCPKCHKTCNTQHPVWCCSSCAKGFGSKCCVCGGPKGVGGGSTGAGKVCDRCYKMNRCTFCGDKI